MLTWTFVAAILNGVWLGFAFSFLTRLERRRDQREAAEEPRRSLPYSSWRVFLEGFALGFFSILVFLIFFSSVGTPFQRFELVRIILGAALLIGMLIGVLSWLMILAPRGKVRRRQH